MRTGMDVLLGQPYGDQVQALALEEFPEDPRDDMRGERVGFQPMKAFTVCCLARIRMWAGVQQAIAVWGRGDYDT
jgi:hypothetical protein